MLIEETPPQPAINFFNRADLITGTAVELTATTLPLNKTYFFYFYDILLSFVKNFCRCCWFELGMKMLIEPLELALDIGRGALCPELDYGLKTTFLSGLHNELLRELLSLSCFI